MKFTNRSIILTTAALFLAGASVAPSQGTIVYVNGPPLPFQYGVEPADAAIDLNQDGAPDFSFQLGYFVTTFGCLYPLNTNGTFGPPICGGATGPYFVWGLGTNSTLHQRINNGSILGFGAFIGDPPPANAAWGNPEQDVTIAYLFIGHSNSGLYGPLANVGVGYVGVRFRAADGVHYGWIRLRSTPFVEVVDWGYQSLPNTPIQAGHISSSGESRQFTVDFPNGDSGSLILTADQLRCELTLNGQFGSAQLIGPARGNGKPIADLGQPLTARTNYTSFFRDVTLSHGDVTQLLRGAVSVSIDDGVVVGKVLPVH
jgi:hypothetical protein